MFGNKLAELIKLNETLTVGLLCLAIKEAGKTTQQMGFQDYKMVFQTQLPKCLEKMKVENKEKPIALSLATQTNHVSVFFVLRSKTKKTLTNII